MQNIKQTIIIFLLGLSIGMLVMVNQVCKQKDSMIRLLMQNNGGSQVEAVNLPEIKNMK